MAASTSIRLTALSLLFVLAFSLACVGGLATPARAHTSDYCGHDQAGLLITVTWVDSWNDPEGEHWHKYEHRRFDLWRVHEDVWAHC